MTEKTVRTARSEKPDAARPKTVRTGAAKSRPTARRTRAGIVLRTLGITAFAVFVLGAIAAGIAYARLQHGPIALTPFLARIEAAISAELGGKSMRIGAAELRQAEAGGYEIGLRNIQMTEPDGAPIASAPEATAAISMRALRSARLALARIDLVRPRLQVFYAADGSLSLQISPIQAEVPQRDATAPDQAIASAIVQAAPNTDDGRIIIIKALANAAERARRQEDSSSYLREFGLKNATVVIDNGKRKSFWRVPDLSIDLAHHRTSTVIEGKATVDVLTGPIDVAFNVVESGKSETLQLAVRVTGLVPRGLAMMGPQWAFLDAIDAPIAGEGQFELAGNGSVRAASGRLLADAGKIRLPGLSGAALALERADLNLSYDGANGLLKLNPSLIAASETTMRLAGQGQYKSVPGGTDGWSFDVASLDATPANPGAPRLKLQGFAASDPQQVQISTLLVVMAGLDIAAEGRITDFDRRTNVPGAQLRPPRIDIAGRIAPFSAATLKAAWPKDVATPARAWLTSHMAKGQVTKANFRIANQAVATPGPPALFDAPRLSLAADATGIEIIMQKGLPPLEIPRATVKFDGETVEISAPDAAIGSGDARRLAIKSARVAIANLSADQPNLDVTFRLSGPLAGVVDLADREPFNLLKSSGVILPGLDGRIDGGLRVQFPLAENLQVSELKTEGKIRVSDLRTRQLAANYDINGGTIAIDLNDKAVDVKGDILVKGVPAKLTAQVLLNVPADRQPPARITAVLDNADRAALGLDINDIVQGEVPIEVTVSREQKSETVVRVRADLTKSELTLEHVAWRKATGRQAILQFDVAKGQGQGAAARTELQNVKLAGDDVAIEGFMAISADNRLREYFFPEFSINTVSRLEVQGKLRNDNIWDVRAKGSMFDGRDIFRSLFNLGQTAQRTTPPKHAGIDLNVEIDTVLGFTESSIKSVKVRSQTRGEKFTSLDASGVFERAKTFRAVIELDANKARWFLAESQDAGQIFRLVGFYPRAVGGIMNLQVNLDERGAADKSGVLWARNFAVLGDSIVGDVMQNADTGQPAIAGRHRKKPAQEQIPFDVMKIPFVVGNSQFVMNDAQIKGPLLGAPFRGKIDFKSQTVDLGGTYVPLAGLNSAVSGIPIVGQILGGAKGEGVFGMPFSIQGALANPQVTVNPVGLIAPGIFKDIFQLTPENYRIDPRADRAVPKAAVKPNPARASSASPTATPAAPGITPRPKSEVLGDWSTETQGSRKK